METESGEAGYLLEGGEISYGIFRFGDLEVTMVNCMVLKLKVV